MAKKTIAQLRTEYLKQFQLAQTLDSRAEIDWQKIATRLASVMPDPKPKRIIWEQWREYSIAKSSGKVARLDTLTVFADGEKVAGDCLMEIKRGPNWGYIIRTAQAFYRISKDQWGNLDYPVPEVTSCLAQMPSGEWIVLNKEI